MRLKKGKLSMHCWIGKQRRKVAQKDQTMLIMIKKNISPVHDSLAEDVKGVCCSTPIKAKSQPPLHIFSERSYQNKTRQVPF